MKKSEQINKLEEMVAALWDDLKACERCLDRVTEYGIEKEIKIFEENVGDARARWATAKRILEFLKGESEEI